jgi:small nuclear ribonucleoprotein (snRNP)-like protein
LFLTDVTVNDRNGSVRMSLKKVFIRGNNILLIYLQG